MSKDRISKDREEFERPTEWLRRLQEDPASYGALLEESGGIARAAYRLARARCRAAAVPMPVPTERELHAAALEVAARSETPRPPPAAFIARECECERLAVITPLCARVP
jgi:hypothetical protein